MLEKNVLIISIDSLRADAVSFLNPDLENTPFLEQLSSDATVFESAFSQAEWTVPSHTSIFTGLYPTEHGVVSGERSLGDHPTLAELLSDRGYETGANFRLNWFTGGDILRGFGDYQIDEREVSGGLIESTKHFIKRLSTIRQISRGIYRGSFRGHMHDQHVVESAIEAINRAEEPFCHFVHLNDAHWPYSPTAPFHKAATNRPTWQLAWNRAYTQQKLFDENNPSSPADSEKMAIMKDLYLGAVRQVDHHVENLITSIPESVLQNTIIIIFGDHGDAFGEHGEIGHNAPIPEVTHVPLILRDPTGKFSSSEINDPVQLIDLYPTLAELLDVGVPETNATNLMQNESPRLAFTHSGESLDRERFLEKYVVWRSPTDYVTWDYQADEYVEHGRTNGLKKALEEHIAELDYVSPEGRGEMTDSAVRQLQDLGYLENS